MLKIPLFIQGCRDQATFGEKLGVKVGLNGIFGIMNTFDQFEDPKKY